MEVCRRGFPEVIRDNDEIYLRHLVGIIESTDELSSLDISKTPHSLHFRLTPSIPKYIEPLIRSITSFNNLFGIRLDMSKSIKTTSVITFDIHQQ